jgi:hypothetical protein
MIEEKVEAVGAALARLDADLERVRKLTGWDWIAAAARQLPHVQAA